MKLIKLEDFQIKIADEALLVRPIRRLFNMDRSKGKETFYKQMSILYFVYSPSSNYSYILDEKDRLKEVLSQEGITDFHMTPEFKAAVDVYKKLVKTSSSELLADTRLIIDKMRQALTSIDFTDVDANTIKTVATIVGMIPKLVKDLAEAEKAVAKELEEQSTARGSQELTVGDIWAEQGV